MVEPQPLPENVPTPEHAITYTPLLGLQGRLAMGGPALIPTQKVDLKAEQLFEWESAEKTLSLMERASLRERTTYWNNREEKTKDAQLTAWKKSVVAKIKAIPQSTIGEDHGEFFEKIGIDTKNFTEKDAQTFYNKYLSKEHAEDGIQQFMSDIKEKFTLNDEGTVDLDALNKHLPAIQWMAGMFGKNSSEIITQITDASWEGVKNADTFVAKRQKPANNLSKHETKLLTFLTEAGTATPEPSPDDDTPPPKDDTIPNIAIDIDDLPEISLSNIEDLKKDNLKGAVQYLNIMQDGIHDKVPPNAFHINKFNMEIRKSDGEFDTTTFNVIMGDRYNLPIGTMVRAGHAFLITNGPHEQGGKWYVSVWNPFGKNGRSNIADTEEIELHGNYALADNLPENFRKEKDLDNQHPEFVVNDVWFSEYKKNPQSANLEALLSQPQFADIRDELRALKFSALQHDAKSCVPLCGYLAALLNRLSDTSIFVTQKGVDPAKLQQTGVERFEADFKIHLRTNNELNPIFAGGNKSEQDALLCLLANKAKIAEVDIDTLAHEYGADPIKLIKKMQEKTAADVLQMKKDGKPEQEIRAHIDAFLQLQVALDRKAFLPDPDTMKKGRLGVPIYIPDGLSDMGSDPEIDEKKRGGREKLRVDKEKTFSNSANLMYELLTHEFAPGTSDTQKQEWITKMVSYYVNRKIKYDYQDQLRKVRTPGMSIIIGLGGDKKALQLGVCRHHALDTQVLLQALGIDSRLMKSDLDNLGPHVNNLVHIGSTWYLLDTTNPEYDGKTPPGGMVYFKKLSENTIDLNAKSYSWELEKTELDGTKKKRKYVSRNNMYSRIRNNVTNPAPSHYV